MQPFVQLPMLFSHNLIYFLFIKNFWACWISAQTYWFVARKQVPILRKFRVSQMRCAPGNRHNDITILIVSNPNKEFVSITLRIT